MLERYFEAMSAGSCISVGTTGFGNGLDFISAWQRFEQHSPPGTSLDFFSIDSCPLSDTDLNRALARHPMLQSYARPLLQRWRRRVPGWNRWHFAGGRVRLTLVIADIASVMPQLGHIDVWLAHDGTAERKQDLPLPARRPATAIVVGGGLAGCATAHALAQRGLRVTLIERGATLANAASGNPRGILHARFGAGMTTLHQFVLAAYGHALALLDEVMPVDDRVRAECGLLQLASPASEAKRIGKLATLEWPEHVLQAVDAARASVLAGLPVAHGGLWFPAGGWVVPPQLCARLADHPGISRQLAREVTSLTRTATGWQADGDDFAFTAECIVVCCAHQARALGQFSAFPLQAVRGQISEFPATASSKALRSVICASGYCAPAVDGMHVAGATTLFDNEDTALRDADHAENLAQLAAHTPALRQALGTVNIERLSGRAGVRCSAPGSMPLVGEVAQGLYCSLAHGTRGLLTAGLAGEVIAASICGQLPPLPAAILSALSPQQRVRATA